MFFFHVWERYLPSLMTVPERACGSSNSSRTHPPHATPMPTYFKVQRKYGFQYPGVHMFVFVCLRPSFTVRPLHLSQRLVPPRDPEWLLLFRSCYHSIHILMCHRWTSFFHLVLDTDLNNLLIDLVPYIFFFSSQLFFVFSYLSEKTEM